MQYTSQGDVLFDLSILQGDPETAVFLVFTSYNAMTLQKYYMKQAIIRVLRIEIIIGVRTGHREPDE